MIINTDLNSSIADLLMDAGISTVKMDVAEIEGGGNNKAFAVYTKSKKYLAKIYYSHPSDTRNRLNAEYSFLEYARKIGIECVPKSIFSIPQKNIGLYEFVQGRKLTSSELEVQHITQAANFVRALNERVEKDNALPTASEGCFSIEQHLLLTDMRVKKLLSLPISSEIDRQARLFVGELHSVWKKLKDAIVAKSGSISIQLNATDRCISPSDFGFHNALLRDNGEICFIDFEYAGWDDPAKMIGDFFSQPAIPVSLKHFDTFISEALGYSKNRHVLAERARLLFPLFQIKWCCIFLNDFLPNAARRRQFSNPTSEPLQRKRLQLEKAQQFFYSRIK
jgi:thiamine kinase-like enzyme